MATYDELLDIATTVTGNALKRKIQVAIVVACDTIRSEAEATPNHTNRMKWAISVLQNPAAMTDRMLWAVLAQNKSVAAASIIAASDASVQTAVDNAVNLMAQG